MGVVGVSLTKNTTLFLAHLVPLGTPSGLVPFIVLIELVSSIMRPFTLAVRLVANIVAGHLLLALVRGPCTIVGYPVFRVVCLFILLLSVLELGVSIIQAYVYIRLRSLYISDGNNKRLL